MTVLNTSAISTKLIFLIVGKHISKLNVQMKSYKSKECESFMDLFKKIHLCYGASFTPINSFAI